MSLVVKCTNPPTADSPLAKIKVLTKGADSLLSKRLAVGEVNKTVMDVTRSYLQNFAKDGLRTLLMCERELDEELYNDWLGKYR